MEESSERRKSSRCPISSLITCQVKVAEQCYQGELKDMSVSGCFVELNSQVDVPCQCEVEIVLHGESSRLKIEGVGGTLLRSDGNGAAIQFDARMEWFALLSSHLCGAM